MHESRQVALKNFVAWCNKHITGDEKGQAQIFLDRLFQAFGRKGSLDVGGTAEMRIKKAKEDGGGTNFADYVWKPIVLIEMKKRGTDLGKHYRQAFDYWTRLVPGRPQYVVLCNFDEFRIYDFNTQLDEPKDTLRLIELPDRYGPLAFLFPTNERPHFDNDRVAVTREAADYLAECFHKLVARKVDRGLAQRFILQTLLALFAEDISLLEKYTVTQLLEDIKEPTDVYDLFGGLFHEMNTPGITPSGRFKGIPYFNGGLFREPARLATLHDDEKAQLLSASRMDWSKVSPEIFGELFQKSMDAEHRHAFGAHFTYPSDIMKIVKPTISDPWTEAIESAKSGKRLSDLQDRLSRLRVLDPACGSGNFLYLAYREMKRLEGRIRDRLTSEFPETQPRLTHVNAVQFFGLDINDFAIELAKVTMTIARKLAIDELHIVDEPALPLDNLDANFRARDALVAASEDPVSEDVFVNAPWPPADVIIGNPPFLGAKRLKPEHGAAYVNRIRKLYPKIPGMADYCVYWFRRAADHLPECTVSDPFVGRAGLVGTQNIRNNKSRVGGLDHVVATGTIVEAVENQPWSGEANVHVSIANWLKTKDQRLLPTKRRLWVQVPVTPGPKKRRSVGSGPAAKEYELVGRLVTAISSSLSDTTDVSTAVSIDANRNPQRVFQGVTTGYEGFVLKPAAARALEIADPKSIRLIKPYMIGRELVSGDGKPRRFLLDADDLDSLSLKAFPGAYNHLLTKVLPAVQKTLETAKRKKSDMVQARQEHLDRWWTFWARRTELRKWLSRHQRIIAASRTQRIPYVFEFISSKILPGDKLQLFAFDDDYSFGVLQSSPHCAWYKAKGARLKNEADYNYSSDSVFDKFPWPQDPTRAQINSIAFASREIRRIRTDALTKIKGGLRAVYRTLEVPGKNRLKEAHAALDVAVLNAYGFNGKSDLLAQLLALNQKVAAKENAGKQVTPPGIPASYREDQKLISIDCIEP